MSQTTESCDGKHVNIAAILDCKVCGNDPLLTKGPTSYKVACWDASQPADKPCYNGLRFGTREEAEAYGVDLFCRWTALQRYEVHESDDQPSHTFRGGVESLG